MKNIFIGMILIFLNFNVSIGNSTINLFPNFVGYLFMLKGLRELADFSPRFTNIVPMVKVMVAYSVIVFVMYLFGITTGLAHFIVFIVGIISTVVSLYISYCIIMGAKDIETAKEQNLESVRLYKLWIVMAVASIFSFFGFLVFAVPLFAIVMIIGFIVNVIYIFAFYKTQKLFYIYNQPADKQEYMEDFT